MNEFDVKSHAFKGRKILTTSDNLCVKCMNFIQLWCLWMCTKSKQASSCQKRGRIVQLLLHLKHVMVHEPRLLFE